MKPLFSSEQYTQINIFIFFKKKFCFFPKDSGQAIPLVVESCIRYINLYGKLNCSPPHWPQGFLLRFSAQECVSTKMQNDMSAYLTNYLTNYMGLSHCYI